MTVTPVTQGQIAILEEMFESRFQKLEAELKAVRKENEGLKKDIKNLHEMQAVEVTGSSVGETLTKSMIDDAIKALKSPQRLISDSWADVSWVDARWADDQP